MLSDRDDSGDDKCAVIKVSGEMSTKMESSLDIMKDYLFYSCVARDGEMPIKGKTLDCMCMLDVKTASLNQSRCWRKEKR